MKLVRGAWLALLFAVTLWTTGCGRRFEMPSAKARLHGYQIVGTFSEGLAAVQGSGELRQGFVDTKGTVVIAPRFFAVGNFSEGVAPAEEEARDGWGFVDHTGAYVIEPNFDAALPFSGGLAAVRIGDKWGFIERSGAERIPPRFDSAWSFSEGRARVVVDGLVGFVDETGAWVVPPSFFKAGDFRNGLAFACERSLCGFVSRDGRRAIDFKYDDAGSFGEGLAPVRQGGKWGYLDPTGKMVLAPTWDEAKEFTEGLALVARVKDGSFDAKFGGYSGRSKFHGFIDTKGLPVFDTKMLGATPFSGGLTVVRLPSDGFCSDCSDYRLMNREGEFLPGRFDSASAMAGGVAVVTVGQASYAIDRKGSPLVEFDHSYPRDLDFAARNSASLRYGFVDPAGETILPHAYISAQSFSDGVAFVEGPWEKKSRLRAFVDRQGQPVLDVPGRVSQALPFTDGLSLVGETIEGSLRYGFMDRAGATVIPVRYADAAPFAEGLAAVKLSRDLGANDWGYVDATGATVIEPRFKAAGSFSNGLAYVEWVTKEHFQVGGVIDRRGEVVVSKPFLPELSGTLFGSPSVVQFQRRREANLGDGLVPVRDGTFVGWVDRSGRRVAAPAGLALLGLFAEGRAPVSTRNSSPSEGGWGYVDTDARLVIEPRFVGAGRFSEGLAFVRDGVGRFGYITPAGEWAIPPMWLDEAHLFVGGRALVKLNGRFGYLDRQGAFAIPPRYLRAESFSEGLAATAVAVARRSRPARIR